MDQPRPRNQAGRLPLIIERPDLAHPVRRVLAWVLTFLAWVLWVAMWIPFLAALGRYLGYDLPTIAFPSQISLDSFLALVNVTPWVIGVALAVVAASYLVEKFKSPPDERDTRWRPVGMDRLAAGAALNPELLAQWQSAQVLYVEHGPLGRVTNASTCPPETRD